MLCGAFQKQGGDTCMGEEVHILPPETLYAMS